MGELERVEDDEPEDAAACADEGVRAEQAVEDGTGHGCDEEHAEHSASAELAFDVVAEDEQEIEVACEVEDVGVEEEVADGSGPPRESGGLGIEDERCPRIGVLPEEDGAEGDEEGEADGDDGLAVGLAFAEFHREADEEEGVAPPFSAAEFAVAGRAVPFVGWRQGWGE